MKMSASTLALRTASLLRRLFLSTMEGSSGLGVDAAEGTSST